MVTFLVKRHLRVHAPIFVQLVDGELLQARRPSRKPVQIFAQQEGMEYQAVRHKKVQSVKFAKQVIIVKVATITKNVLLADLAEKRKERVSRPALHVVREDTVMQRGEHLKAVHARIYAREERMATWSVKLD